MDSSKATVGQDSNPEDQRSAAPRPISRGDGARRDYRPKGTEMGTGWWPTLKRTATEFSEDNLASWAAALTYYALLALFPALIALVSLVGLFGEPRATTQTITEMVTSIGPKSAAQTFSGPITSVTGNHGGAGVALGLGVLVALWSASGWVGSFMTVSNIVYETREGRPIWKRRPLQLLVTLVMVVLMALIVVALVLTGPLVTAVAKPLGISSTATTIWDIAKWPVLAAVFILMLAILYYASPNARLRGFRWVTPGSIVALVIWILASAAFGAYVASFGSYNKTYGSLAGVVVLLMWFWISNMAILFGHQLNAERERSLEIREGRPRADRELQLEPRDEPDRQRTT